jgi:hypothetical protein
LSGIGPSQEGYLHRVGRTQQKEYVYKCPEWDSNSGDEDARERIAVYTVVIVILINFVVISVSRLSFYAEENSTGISSSHKLRVWVVILQSV